MQANELKPQFVIVIGGAGSGKNYFIEHNPIYSKYHLVDVDAMKAGMDTNTAIKQIMPSLLSAFEKRENVVHTTMGINLKGQENKIKLAKEHGYNVSLIFIDTNPDVAVAQVRNRVRQGGHDVSIENIVSSNKKARENFNILKPLVDNVQVVGAMTEVSLPSIEPKTANEYQDLYRQKWEYNPNKFVALKHSEFDVLGVGAEAIVVKPKNDLSVIKIYGSAQKIKNSGTMQYYLLSQKYSRGNPFLPRVQSIHQSNRANVYTGIEEHYIIKLEELTPLRFATEHDIESMFYSIFNTEPESNLDYNRLATIIELAVEKPNKLANYFDVTKINKNFLNVVKLIRKIKERADSSFDIHTGNMMIRRTSVGPQLVITDPLIN